MTGFIKGKREKRCIRHLLRRAKAPRLAAEYLASVLLVLTGLFLCSPVFLLLSGSITGEFELARALKPALLGGGGFISWEFIPEFPTFASFRKLLFYSPQFFLLFWNSIKMVLLILAGQLLIAVPAAWAFAVYQFPFRRMLFTLYIVLMLMPFQVTMLSSYLVLDKLRLLDTQGSVILPAVFSTFPVFLIYRGFRSVHPGLLEAGRIDGLSEYGNYFRIALPLSKPSIATMTIFSFVAIWNDYMGPLIYFNSTAKKTIQLGIKMFIGQYSTEYGLVMAASVLSLIPVLLIFLAGQKFFVQGIASSGIKG